MEHDIAIKCRIEPKDIFHPITSLLLDVACHIFIKCHNMMLGAAETPSAPLVFL